MRQEVRGRKKRRFKCRRNLMSTRKNPAMRAYSEIGRKDRETFRRMVRASQDAKELRELQTLYQKDSWKFRQILLTAKAYSGYTGEKEWKDHVRAKLGSSKTPARDLLTFVTSATAVGAACCIATDVLPIHPGLSLSLVGVPGTIAGVYLLAKPGLDRDKKRKEYAVAKEKADIRLGYHRSGNSRQLEFLFMGPNPNP